MFVFLKDTDVDVLSEYWWDDSEFFLAFDHTFDGLVKSSFWNPRKLSPLRIGGGHRSENLCHSFLAPDELIGFIVDCVIHSQINVRNKNRVVSMEFGILPI